MSRIDERLGLLGRRGECAVVPYVMAGYRGRRATLAAVRGAVRGGADIVELGFPYSDPLADGPVIQDAGTAALRGGMDMDGFLGLVEAVRKETDVPLVLMTYSNVAYRRGLARFVSGARRAGIDGVILPDMAVEESGEYLAAAAGRVDTIFLASPNTGRARMARIARASSGFLYLVAVYGTTGARTGVKRYTLEAIKMLKNDVMPAGEGAGIPVGVGFGVSGPQDVKRYARAGADAVIVGSAYVRLIGGTPAGGIGPAVASFTRGLKGAAVRGGAGR